MTAPRTRAATASPDVPQDAQSDSPQEKQGPPPNIHVAIARVAADIGFIAKDQQVTAGPARFKFRGVDNVLNTIHEPLVTHGVSIVPTGFTVLDQTVGVTKSGGAQQHLLGIVNYRIIGPAGDYVEAAILAEAQDTSDKSASKLMSMAYKYLAFQMFSIPIEGALEESDRDSSPREVNQAGPQVTIEDVHNRIKASADLLGMDVESITGQFREKNGGLSMEAFYALPVDKVFGFAQQLTQYTRQQQAKAQTTDTTN
jgi:hypothetical protein